MPDEVRPPEGAVPEGTVEKPGEKKPDAPQPPQNPVKEALEKVRKDGGGNKPKSEQILHNRNKARAEQERLDREYRDALIAEGKDPDAPENARPTDEVPEWYRREKAKEVAQTAHQMADSITDPDERELAKHYLEVRIKPSGNPEQDLRDARALVNSVKNSRILEEANRRPTPPRGGSPAGRPPTADELANFQPTQEEARMMKFSGLTAKDVMEARKQSEQA